MALSKIRSLFHASAQLDDRIFKTAVAVLMLSGGAKLFNIIRRSRSAALDDDDYTIRTSRVIARFALDDTARPEYLRLALGLGLAVYSGYLDAYRIGYVFDFVKAATGGSTLQELGQKAIVLLAFDTFLAVTNWFQSQFLEQASDNFSKRLKLKIFSALLKQEIGFFYKRDFDQLKILLDQDTTSLCNFFVEDLPDLVDRSASIIAQLWVVWGKSRKLTTLMLASFSVMMHLSRLKQRLRIDTPEICDQPRDNSTEVLLNIKSIRTMRREVSEKDKYERFLFFEEERSLGAKALDKFVGSMWWAMYKGYWLLNLWYGGRLVIDKEVPADELQTLLEVATGIHDSMNIVMLQLEEFEDIAEPGERIFKLLDRVPKVRSGKGSVNDPAPRGEIVFHDVAFYYGKKGEAGETPPPVLLNFNLRIPPGTHVGFVGPSGSGKSTVLALMQRFYDPSEGGVLLDGHDLRDLNLDWLYQHLSAISSSSVLFSGTIEDNIRYGKQSATHVEMVQMCEQACILEDIEALPEKFKTPISVLSNALRQRIAIARVMLKGPSVVLLDEPTFGIDAKTEPLVQLALQRLTKGRTVLMIASRLSSIMSCDAIAVIDTGRVVEFGSPQELASKQGGYLAKLLQNQSSLGTDDANAELHAQPEDVKDAMARLEAALKSRPDDALLTDVLNALRAAWRAVERERTRVAEITSSLSYSRPDILTSSYAPGASPATAAGHKLLTAVNKMNPAVGKNPISRDKFIRAVTAVSKLKRDDLKNSM